MAHEHVIARYRQLYAILLRLYSKPFRDRFGEGMEQTFNDLCRERKEADEGLFAFALWAFAETFAGIMRDRITMIMMQDTTRRLTVWAAIIALILMIPLAAMQFTNEVNWHFLDFVVMGALLSGVGLMYELVARRSEKTVYRVAFGIGLVAAVLLFWVNGAVGIIGNEGQPANLLYGAVFAVGFFGAIITRFKPHGMARVLFAMAFVQALVPVIALIIWPPQVISWGEAGVTGVFVLNAYFVMLFAGSACLFRNAAREQPPAGAGPLH